MIGHHNCNLKWNEILLFLYIVCLPLNHISLPGIGAAYQLIMIPIIVFFVMQLFILHNGKLYLNGALKAWFMLTVFQAATILWSENPNAGVNPIISLIEVFIATVFLANETYTTRSKKIIEEAFLISGIVYFIYALFFTVEQIYTARKIITFGTYGSVDPNEWCIYLIVPVAIATAKLYEEEKLYKKFFFTLYLLLTLYLSLLGGSRGGLLAIITTFLFIILHRSKFQFKALFFGSFLFITIVLFSYYFILPRIPTIVMARFSLEGVTAYGGGSGRVGFWRAILNYISSDLSIALFGNGLYGALSVPYVAHNQYLQVFLDSGIIGFILYVVLLYNIYKNAKKRGEIELGSFFGVQIALLSLTAYGWFKAVYIVYLICLLKYEKCSPGGILSKWVKEEPSI